MEKQYIETLYKNLVLDATLKGELTDVDQLIYVNNASERNCRSPKIYA